MKRKWTIGFIVFLVSIGIIYIVSHYSGAIYVADQTYDRILYQVTENESLEVVDGRKDDDYIYITFLGEDDTLSLIILEKINASFGLFYTQYGSSSGSQKCKTYVTSESSGEDYNTLTVAFGEASGLKNYGFDVTFEGVTTRYEYDKDDYFLEVFKTQGNEESLATVDYQ